MTSPFRRAVLIVAATIVLGSGSGHALDLVGLSDANQLVLFNDSTPAQAQAVKISGVAGRIVGMDFRPADGQLYALSADGNIYRLIPATATATWVSKLSVPFDAAQGAVVDFNPVADRLRVIGGGGKVNLRINVENGQAVEDKPLAYVAGDANAGKTPMVTAGAYINSLPGAKQTQLFDIDSGTGSYLIQDPPNDGVLATIGATGAGAKRIAAIDILTDAAGEYIGFAVADNTLYALDVAKGMLTVRGTVGRAPIKLIDIAIVSTVR